MTLKITLSRIWRIRWLRLQQRLGTTSLITKPLVKKATEGHFFLAKQVIATGNQSKNLVISPLSIHFLLSLCAAGSSGLARDEVLTYLKSEHFTYLKSESAEHLCSFYSQIAATIFADGGRAGGPLLSTVNGVWADCRFRFKWAFQYIVDDSYKAVAQRVHFHEEAEKCRQEVNAWCEKESNGLIKEILPRNSVSFLTRLIFVNAVYYKGTWSDKFDASLTRDADFHLINGSSVRAPFMTSRKWRKCVRAFDGFKVLKLPYRQGSDEREFSMYIYLPDARDGLPSLIERVCSKPGFVDSHLPHKMVDLEEFRIPKFKIGFEFEASEVLRALGVVGIFEIGQMTQVVNDDLWVDMIRHKAFVEVNEVGTEAGAVTVLGMYGSCGPRPQPRLSFVADHPFMFTIREDTTGVVLFIGQLLDPLAC